MPAMDSVQAGGRASPAQQAIRTERARKARREYGFEKPDHAVFHAWLAWQRGDGTTRRDLEPLAAVESILWRAVFELAPEEAPCNG